MKGIRCVFLLSSIAFKPSEYLENLYLPNGKILSNRFLSKFTFALISKMFTSKSFFGSDFITLINQCLMLFWSFKLKYSLNTLPKFEDSKNHITIDYSLLKYFIIFQYLFFRYFKPTLSAINFFSKFNVLFFSFG